MEFVPKKTKTCNEGTGTILAMTPCILDDDYSFRFHLSSAVPPYHLLPPCLLPHLSCLPPSPPPYRVFYARACYILVLFSWAAMLSRRYESLSLLSCLHKVCFRMRVLPRKRGQYFKAFGAPSDLNLSLSSQPSVSLHSFSSLIACLLSLLSASLLPFWWCEFLSGLRQSSRFPFKDSVIVLIILQLLPLPRVLLRSCSLPLQIS